MIRIKEKYALLRYTIRRESMKQISWRRIISENSSILVLILLFFMYYYFNIYVKMYFNYT